MEGENLKAKAAALESMRGADAHALAKRIGFMVRLAKGEGLVIPAGYLYSVATGPTRTEMDAYGFIPIAGPRSQSGNRSRCCDMSVQSAGFLK